MVAPPALSLRGTALTLEDVVGVARRGRPVVLAPEAVEAMRAGRATVERALEEGQEVYGLTTGVGSRKRTRVARADQSSFNRMLVESHRVGQGASAPADAVRAAVLCLANGLARGHAGVRPEVAERLVQALGSDRRPHVRLLGSLGEADLAQNADLAHALFDDGELAAKEALALLSNNAFSTGLAALAVADLECLLDTLDVAGALDLEAFAANVSARPSRRRRGPPLSRPADDPPPAGPA